MNYCMSFKKFDYAAIVKQSYHNKSQESLLRMCQTAFTCVQTYHSSSVPIITKLDDIDYIIDAINLIVRP